MTDREQLLRFWSAHVAALARHLDRKPNVRKDKTREKALPPGAGVPDCGLA
jgi:hypothetical protein